jgi:CheY-like chemotaxis protein
MARNVEPGFALLAALLCEFTILVVEDDAAARDATQLLLEELGALVVVAVDGRDALDRLPRVDPDLVLTDLAMPRLSGGELLARLRADPAHRSLPVIAVSAGPRPSKANAPVFDGHLDKPYDLRSLAGVLCRVICCHRRVFSCQRRRLCHLAAQQRRDAQRLRERGSRALKLAAAAQARGRSLFATVA